MSLPLPSVRPHARLAPRVSASQRMLTLLVLLAAFVVLVALPGRALAALPPSQDPFYAAPANLATYANGAVIRSRPASLRTAPGLGFPYKAYQVAYRTTDRLNVPIVDVATIMLPSKHLANAQHLVSYQTAYDGLRESCQPSYSLQTGRVGLQGAETLLMNGLLSRGYTVVTADYEGPDNAWLVEQTTGHGVLDGIRAAENFAPDGLTGGASTQVGMMGYSGGGQATADASEMAASYAPELHIVGAAEGGIAADLGHALGALDGQLFAGIAFAALAGISTGYPDVDFNSYLNNHGRSVIRQLRGTYSCISDFAGTYAFQQTKSLLRVKSLQAIPGFTAIAAENSLGHAAPSMPIFLFQTQFDELGGIETAKALVRKYCAAGTSVQFSIGHEGEHAIEVFDMPFQAEAWLANRFNGNPLNSNCGRFT
jgi:hypothetical protein